METYISEGERIDRINENVTLIQKKNGLVFGTDAYLLYAYMRKAGNSSVACDLGAGTGVISLLAASKKKFSKIYAIEVQKEFCNLIERNAELNGLNGTVIPIEGDLRENLPVANGTADVVFSNPPYMRQDSGKLNDAECKYIARHEIRGNISDFCLAASKLLKFGGSFYTVWRPERLCDLLCAMRENKIEPKRMTFIHPDSGRMPSLVLTEGKRGGLPGLYVTKPLYMHIDASASVLCDTAEMKQIYESGEFCECYYKQ